MNVPRRSVQQPSSANLARPVSDILSPRVCLIAALALVAIVFAIYSPALNFQFILDDHRFTQDHRIQFSGYVWDYFANFVWAQFTGAPPSFYRPIFLLWMRINFVLAGLSHWGWHLLSITKHVLVAALLGYLVWTLLRDRMAALLAATLFALHPAQTESVAWVTVPDPLMSAAILGSLLLYLRYIQDRAADPGITRIRERSRKTASNRAPATNRTWWLIASAGCGLIALLAKETAVILPALIFAGAWVQPHSQEAVSLRGKPQIPSGVWSRTRVALGHSLPFVLVIFVYLLLRLNALGGRISSSTQHLPLKTLLLSWPATLWFYVKVLFWPVRSRAFADPTLVERFSVRAVLVPTVGLLSVAGVLLGVSFWVWKQSRRSPSKEKATGLQIAVVFGMLLLMLPVVLTLDLNALNPGDFLHGRYTYLPLAGLMLLAATAWHLSRHFRIPLLALAVILAIICSTLTLAQESQWRDDLTVFKMAHDLAPQNRPVARHLADARIREALLLNPEGKCDATFPLFEQVSRDFPDDWFAWAAMGNCWLQRNELSQAEAAFHRAVDISHDPTVTQAWQQLRSQLGLPISSPSTN